MRSRSGASGGALRARLAAFVLCATALGGCDSTAFRSAPVGTTTPCDQRFVGAWYIVPHGVERCDEPERCGALIVDSNCSAWHPMDLAAPSDAQDDRIMQHARIAFADVHGRHLLTLGIEPDSAAEPVDPPGWKMAYFYFRYEVAGSNIRLYAVDSARVAELIKTKILRGRADETRRTKPGAPPQSRPVIYERHNYVEGSAGDMARIALLPGMFESDPWVVLKPAAPGDIVHLQAPTATP